MLCQLLKGVKLMDWCDSTTKVFSLKDKLKDLALLLEEYFLCSILDYG
jgi:hypothetical protein